MHFLLSFKGGFITGFYLLSRSVCLVGQVRMAEAEQLQLSGRVVYSRVELFCT